MGNKTTEIQILFHNRVSPSRGGTSSHAQNDMMDEVAHDLADIQNRINNSLVPAMAALPDGVIDSSVNAFANGIDAKNMYANAVASPSNDASYYNNTALRPYTVYEELNSIYTEMSSIRSDVTDQLAEFSKLATDVTIADISSLYVASNVEAALTEVMEKVNLLALGQIDLAAISSTYIPSVSETYDIGTSVAKIRNMYLSNVLFLGPLSSDPAITTPGAMYYNTSLQKIKFRDSTGWRTVSST